MKRHVAILILLFVVANTTNSYSISPIEKATKDYTLTLEAIRSIRVMVENFGDDGLKKKYADIRIEFQDASENYYGQNFSESASKFKKVKMELIAFLGVIDDLYLKRTKEILDSTSKDTFDSLIEYSKTSGLAAYFTRPYDPLKDVKPYDTDKYHLFHDRERISAYLREGYKKYHEAKNIYEDPEIALLRKKTTMTVKNMNYIIARYSDVIFLCRQAKECGIEIHRVKNTNELGKSMVKYNVSHGSIIPIFDDRIPEKYKVDANDNMRFIHAVELKKLSKKQGGTSRDSRCNGAKKAGASSPAFLLILFTVILFFFFFRFCFCCLRFFLFFFLFFFFFHFLFFHFFLFFFFFNLFFRLFHNNSLFNKFYNRHLGSISRPFAEKEYSGISTLSCPYSAARYLQRAS